MMGGAQLSSAGGLGAGGPPAEGPQAHRLHGVAALSCPLLFCASSQSAPLGPLRPHLLNGRRGLTGGLALPSLARVGPSWHPDMFLFMAPLGMFSAFSSSMKGIIVITALQMGKLRLTPGSDPS